MENYEEEFIHRIDIGLTIIGKELTDIDLYALKTKIPSGLYELDKRFRELGIDRQEWNDRMVEALKAAFYADIAFMTSGFDEKYLEASEPPHEVWDRLFREMYTKSDTVLTGVVQNWYHKYWKVQTGKSVAEYKNRKNATKISSTGCLLPIILSLLLFSMIFYI